MAIESAWKTILRLEENIKKHKNDIVNYNKNLEEQLSGLRTSFQDDGFFIIQNLVKKTEEQINDSFPAFEALLNKMLDVAALLKKAEDATAYQYERTR